MLRAEFVSPAFGLTLLFLLGISLDCTLSHSGRQAMPVVSLALEDGVDRGYGGKFSRDPLFQQHVSKIVRMRRLALDRAMRRTGIRAGDTGIFVVGFKDASLESGFGASSRPVRTREGDVHLVTLSAEQLMLGVMDIQASLVHEFIHCVMRERMGHQAYRALPGWVREGIAVWGADQLDERSRNLVANLILVGNDFHSLIPRINESFNRRDPYLLYALGFEYLAREYGDSSVRVLIDAIVGGSRPEEAFQGVTGLAWEEFVRLRREFAGRYLAGMLADSGLFEFNRAQRLREQGDLRRAIPAMREMIDRHPGSLLLPKAWYWVGRWNQELGCHRRAALAYQALLADWPGCLGLRDDARLRLADCLGRLGDHQEVLDQLEIWFQDHPDESWPVQADARYFLGRTHFQMGNYRMAAASLRIAAQASRVHAPKALYYLALAQLQTGKRLAGQLTAGELAGRFPRFDKLEILRHQIAEFTECTDKIR